MELIELKPKQIELTARKTLGQDWNLEKFYIAQVYFASIIQEIGREILIANIGENSEKWLEAQLSFEHLKCETSTLLHHCVSSVSYYPDLFRQLYENTFPGGLRKLLGEFQTPYWLVKVILKKMMPISGLSVCDPTCGVGSFLLGAIDTIVQEKTTEKHDCETMATIIASIRGFDLNPLAVLASRINLLAVYSSKLCPNCQPTQIPIYFADTAYNPFKKANNGHSKNHEAEMYDFSTMEFAFPNEFVDLPDSDMISHITTKIDRNLDVCQFVLGSIRAYLGKKAQTIVGNPPWVAWDGIKEKYRNRLAKHWKFLFTQKGWRSKVAAGRVDLSAIMVYSAHQYFSQNDAKMVFLLPESVFKGRGAGEGFRRFESSKGIFSVTKVLDLTGAKLFSEASNRTVCASFSNSNPQDYPVPWVVCSNISQVGKKPWEETEKIAFPILENDRQSPWLTISSNDLHWIRKCIGKSAYRARGGVNTGGANPVFWVRSKGQQGELTYIENLHKSIRMEVECIQGLVEPQMLRPLIRGRDVGRWKWKSELSILFPYQDYKSTKDALLEDFMKIKYPYTLKYLMKFKGILENRKEYKRWGSRGPWYQLFRIGPYTFAKYKVIWQHTGFQDEMRACVVETCVPIVDQKVILVPFNSKEEAHFFCSLLNSQLVFEVLSSYLLLDASTHILEYLRIGKYDSESKIQRKLAELSMEAHSSPEEATNVEMEINDLAAQYWLL
ncbi:MAG: Eco57I restriction-modification methylase domain-containing protein [Candidatus Hodarchaeota archaeon]